MLPQEAVARALACLSGASQGWTEQECWGWGWGARQAVAAQESGERSEGLCCTLGLPLMTCL